MLDEVGDELVVVANTGDDVEIYGAHVSPDPDLVTFWLADRIDERGWGLRRRHVPVMDGLRELGDDVWFNLGDRDLAICLRRARRLAEGARADRGDRRAARARSASPARVLPMCDEPVRTAGRARAARLARFQEFMIRERAAGPGRGRRAARDRGARGRRRRCSRRSPRARAIVIGPSNPVISIGPILAVPGMRDALAAAPARRRRLPDRRAARCSRARPTRSWPGPATRSASEGIAAHYDGLLDGLVADERADSVPHAGHRRARWPTTHARRRVAREALAFAAALAG